MRFGAAIWDYYVEYAKCLDLPQVLVVCFGDLDANLEGELPRLAEFLGLPPLDAEATQRVLHLCSRQSMLEMSSKFDESWTYSELRTLRLSGSGGGGSCLQAPLMMSSPHRRRCATQALLQPAVLAGFLSYG